MSHHRINPKAGFREADRDPEGRRLCRRCSNPVPKKRRNWCSEECVHQHRLTSDPGYLRRQVFKRDRGVCSACGLDTEALRQELRAMDYMRRREAMKRLGIPSHREHGPWDADHIVPVVEGGGECGLDNIRTLCCPCHKRATTELARRRTLARRAAREAARQPLLPHPPQPLEARP